MKRLLCLFFALCLLLTACGNKSAEVPTEPPTEAPTTEATQAPTTEATEPPTTEATEPETEPTEPPAPIHPLTGKELEAEYTGRPVSFTLNNISGCLPQYGLDKLDWMFEVETEGGVTRCVGIMTDPASADVVGPIRSCRTYFLNISVSYNAPLFHCGGSEHSDAYKYNESERLSDWDHVNQKEHNYFYRDKNRYNNLGYSWEHTLFTSGDRMVKAMDDLGYSATSGEPVTYGYQFSDSVQQLDGQSANKVVITFEGSKDTVMKYDAETGLYKAYQYGQDWIEGSTGENATFRNLLVVMADQTKPKNKHSFYDIDGTGEGYFAVDGQLVPVTWHHDDVEGPFHFTLADGTPITLGVGTTYCAIVGTNGSVIAE